MSAPKKFLKSILLTKPVAETINRLQRVVALNYEGNMFARFEERDLFKNMLDGSEEFSSRFGDRKSYILTDQLVGPTLQAKLGPKIESLDALSDAEVRDALFYIHFECDSDALSSLQRITACSGRYIPHLNFGKTDFRFTDRLVLNALKRTWGKSDRVSHLTPVVHENICEALSITRSLPGDYVEIGVFIGGSALTAVNMIDELRSADETLPERKAWLLDTFDGFNYEEAYDSPDAIWAGTHKLRGVDETMAYIRETLSDVQIPNELVAGNICVMALPAGIEWIAVANVDVDMYEPTLAALEKVSPLIVPGGIIICEDPASTPSLFGAYQAMEEFLATEEGARYIKIFKKGQYFLLKAAQQG